MKTFRQNGDVLTIPAPAGGAVGGKPYISGSIVGVFVADVAEGSPASLDCEGVHELAKTSAQAWTLGAKVYWDGTNNVATTTASGNSLIGVAAAAAANPSAAGLVKIGLVP